MAMNQVNALYRWLFHYYVALTMSAGAVAPMIGPAPLDAPPAIVRRYVQPGAGRWDPRESVLVHGRVAVLTTSLDSRPGFSGGAIHQN